MITCYFEDGGKASLRHVVIDVIVIKDGQLLMVRRAPKLLEGGKWGLVGGYMERDETIKETVAREVLEETGWEIRDISLLAVVDRADRIGEDRQNVAFKFFCGAVKKTGKADQESEEQRWFSLDNLPSRNRVAFDHYDDIVLYKKYLNERLTIPILP